MSFSYKKSKNNNETATAKKIVKRLKLFLVNSTEIPSRNLNQQFSGNYRNEIGDFENGENEDLTKIGNDDMIGEEGMIEKDIFSIILRTFGVILSDLKLLILSDSTDINPYGNKIKIDVIYDILKVKNNDNYDNYKINKCNSNKYNDNDSNENGNENIGSNYDLLCVENLSESSVFSLKHIARQIWRSADQLKRFEIYFVLSHFILF